MTTFRTTHDIANELFFSIDGATVHTVVGATAPKTGYVVGIPGKGLSATTISVESISEWVDSVKSLSGLPNYFLGIWQDSETDIFYLDVVQVFPEKAVALKAAKDRGELAIWSLTDSEEIRIG